jgi:hypothetical protein
MYRHEYVPGSNAQPRVTTRLKAGKLNLKHYNAAKLKYISINSKRSNTDKSKNKDDKDNSLKD